MLSQTTFHRLYRLSAWYDLAMSAPFALAPTAALLWSGLGALGLVPAAALDAHAMLFANFFGSIVTLWSILRLRLNQPALARWDAMGRLSFSLAMATALAQGGSPALIPILAAEMAWAVLQLLPVKR